MRFKQPKIDSIKKIHGTNMISPANMGIQPSKISFLSVLNNKIKQLENIYS